MSQIPGWRVCPVFCTYALPYTAPRGRKLLLPTAWVRESIIKKTVNQCYSANEMMKSTSEPFN